jgi:hypothetical protein
MLGLLDRLSSRSVQASGFRIVYSLHALVSKIKILREFWQFLRVRKKYWLAPIVIVLVLLSLLIVLTQGSALAPFIYALF